MSPYQNHRIRIKLSTDEDTPVPSATSVFPGGPNWFERGGPTISTASCSRA